MIERCRKHDTACVVWWDWLACYLRVNLCFTIKNFCTDGEKWFSTAPLRKILSSLQAFNKKAYCYMVNPLLCHLLHGLRHSFYKSSMWYIIVEAGLYCISLHVVLAYTKAEYPLSCRTHQTPEIVSLMKSEIWYCYLIPISCSTIYFKCLGVWVECGAKGQEVTVWNRKSHYRCSLLLNAAELPVSSCSIHTINRRWKSRSWNWTSSLCCCALPLPPWVCFFLKEFSFKMIP